MCQERNALLSKQSIHRTVDIRLTIHVTTEE